MKKIQTVKGVLTLSAQDSALFVPSINEYLCVCLGLNIHVYGQETNIFDGEL